MDSKKRLSLIALTGVPLLMVLGNSMLIPLFPEMKNQMSITQFQVGLLITFFSIPAGLAIPFLGYLSDRYGRKVVIVPALIVYGLGGLISGLAPVFFAKPYAVMLAGRIVQGLGAAGTAPVTMALVGDIFTNKERSKALGIIEASNGMGKVISPILGSLLALIFWYFLFYVYAVLAVPIAAAVWWLVKEPPLSEERKNQSLSTYWQGIKTTFQNKGSSLAICFLAGMYVLFALFGVLSYLSDIIEDQYGYKGVIKGMIIAVPVLFLAITSYTTGILIQKTTPKRLKIIILIGFGLVTTSLGLNAFTVHPWLSVGLLALMGVGAGLVLAPVNTLVTSSVPTKKRGTVTSLYGSVRFIGVAFGPPTFSLLVKGGTLLMFLTVSGVALLITIGLFFFLKPQSLTPQQKNESSSTKKKTKNHPPIGQSSLAYSGFIGTLEDEDEDEAEEKKQERNHLFFDPF